MMLTRGGHSRNRIPPILSCFRGVDTIGRTWAAIATGIRRPIVSVHPEPEAFMLLPLLSVMTSRILS